MELTIAADDREKRLVQRQGIEKYEAALKAHVGSDHGDRDAINDDGLQEFIVGGAYTRVLTIPADTTIVSKLWTKERLWIIIYGRVRIVHEMGEEVIEGPYVGQAPFGSKVALYTETETMWAAVTGCPDTENIDELESIMTTENYDQLTYAWSALEGDAE
jgi:hypothetical protein